MKSTRSKSSSVKFVEGSKVISKPGAMLVVKELILTDYGRQSITSGSKGIKEGAKEIFGPPRERDDNLAPA